ncbi:unnamed protein product [Boreogadus saida]
MSATAVAKGNQRSTIRVPALLFGTVGTAVVERAPCRRQSRSPAPARDSGLTCSEFTWTLHSLPPHPSYARIFIGTGTNALTGAIWWPRVVTASTTCPLGFQRRCAGAGLPQRV